MLGGAAGSAAGLDRLSRGRLSRGLLHTDPAPDAFRRDPARAVCGLIDWSVAMACPVLYARRPR
jgi:hypothetical protein